MFWWVKVKLHGGVTDRSYVRVDAYACWVWWEFPWWWRRRRVPSAALGRAVVVVVGVVVRGGGGINHSDSSRINKLICKAGSKN